MARRISSARIFLLRAASPIRTDDIFRKLILSQTNYGNLRGFEGLELLDLVEVFFTFCVTGLGLLKSFNSVILADNSFCSKMICSRSDLTFERTYVELSASMPAFSTFCLGASVVFISPTAWNNEASLSFIAAICPVSV